MSDDEQPDDHLSLIAKANGKAPHDRHDVMHLQTVSGPVIDNRNQISTPALVMLLSAFFVSATIGALAIGMSWHALDTAHTAEREGRLAQERADRLEVDVKVMLAIEGKR